MEINWEGISDSMVWDVFRIIFVLIFLLGELDGVEVGIIGNVLSITIMRVLLRELNQVAVPCLVVIGQVSHSMLLLHLKVVLPHIGLFQSFAGCASLTQLEGLKILGNVLGVVLVVVLNEVIVLHYIIRILLMIPQLHKPPVLLMMVLLAMADLSIVTLVVLVEETGKVAIGRKFGVVELLVVVANARHVLGGIDDFWVVRGHIIHLLSSMNPLVLVVKLEPGPAILLGLWVEGVSLISANSIFLLLMVPMLPLNFTVSLQKNVVGWQL